MDHKSRNATVHGAIITTPKEAQQHINADSQRKKKKKRGPMHLIRVALYMLKFGKSTKSNNNANIVKNFLGSMRPLHVQTPKSPPQLTKAPASAPVQPVRFLSSPDHEHLEVFTPPMSPAQASTSSCGLSRYASAMNLHELDHSDESANEDELLGKMEADDMIDIKAEQFIAQFYQQMKVQNEVYTNRRHRGVNVNKN